MTYPIVLAHGVCRFDILWNESLNADNNDDPRVDRLNYFRGIRTMLKDKGYLVYHSKVGWAADVDKRGADLKENILKILRQAGAEKVNIIAHSMGGLDSRHMMFNDRSDGKIHERIASLTTISTPHSGSPFPAGTTAAATCGTSPDSGKRPLRRDRPRHWGASRRRDGAWRNSCASARGTPGPPLCRGAV